MVDHRFGASAANDMLRDHEEVNPVHSSSPTMSRLPPKIATRPLERNVHEGEFTPPGVLDKRCRTP